MTNWGPISSWIDKTLLPQLCTMCFITFLAIYHSQVFFSGKIGLKFGIGRPPPPQLGQNPCWPCLFWSGWFCRAMGSKDFTKLLFLLSIAQWLEWRGQTGRRIESQRSGISQPHSGKQTGSMFCWSSTILTCYQPLGSHYCENQHYFAVLLVY